MEPTTHPQATLNTKSNQIEIRFPYQPSLVEVVRTLPDRYWDRNLRAWTLPSSPFHARKVVDLLTTHSFQIDPRIQKVANPSRKVSYLRDGLYPFQSEDVDRLLQLGGRALIGHEMGLGKTVIALAFLKELDSHRALTRILVVTTASTVWKWAKEVERWTGWTGAVIANSTMRLPLDSKVWIISSTLMNNRIHDLVDQPFDAVIADECHQFSNPKAQRTASLRRLASKADFFLPMSGTPFLNRPVELFSILNMLQPELYANWWRYVHRYCAANRAGGFLDVSGASHLDELAERLKDIMIRRTKQEVLKDLPSLTRNIMPVDVNTEEIRNALASLVLRLKTEDPRNPDHLVQLAKLRYALGMSKAVVAVEMASEYVQQTGRKVVIYAHHKDVVHLIMSGLERAKITVSCIVGDVDQAERARRVTAFQNTPYPQVMVISSAGGEGIDLFGRVIPADLIIFAEREWNPAKEEQAEARLHRIGQESAVTALYLVARDTVDETIAALIESKRDMIGQVMRVDAIDTHIVSEFLSSLLK